MQCSEALVVFILYFFNTFSVNAPYSFVILLVLFPHIFIAIRIVLCFSVCIFRCSLYVSVLFLCVINDDDDDDYAFTPEAVSELSVLYFYLFFFHMEYEAACL